MGKNGNYQEQSFFGPSCSRRIKLGSSSRGGKVRKLGPRRKIIKNRKPLTVRKANCDAQNALLEETLRKEWEELGVSDPFSPSPPNGGLELYSERAARWARVGKLCPKQAPGAGKHALKLSGCGQVSGYIPSSSQTLGTHFVHTNIGSGVPLSISPISPQEQDRIHYRGYVRHQEAAKSVLAEAGGVIVCPDEVRAVFLALRGHMDVCRGQQIVRDAAKDVAKARREAPPSEEEIRAVILRINSMLRSPDGSTMQTTDEFGRQA